MTPATALRRCRAAFTETYNAFAAADPDGELTNPREVTELCSAAYKAAMPPLTDWRSIRAHIACVSQGLLLGALSEKEARTLMFTAQTQLSTFAREQKSQ